ncbi:LysM peptidoglycan-binding domain-containing protein [Gordonia sp. (in: high G+C Gram-positive bacteria)]|uniref:LysM peptidoglycan-binding domain-containing protein n=1 Tax=Gordonia sp. (in: high G+C Gram-positive bacteria) TaxID=84139 RepID=UPI0026331EF1|nr:LysM peptidoglycan-binding domain-containing protein [Gordonia sp. (in: high G+C Gram-positive bacteria)]
MAGIDAQVVLGLAGKLGQVFADDGTYQAYPLSPIGLRAEHLRSLVTDPLGAGIGPHAEFSTLVNSIPAGPVWNSTEQGSLWDVYGDVLTRAELIEDGWDPSEKAKYDAAFGLLYENSEDGIPRPTATALEYERYRDRYLAATTEYNNRRGEAELSDDADVKDRWARDEPTLRAEIEAAGAAWSGAGRRAAVDQARQTIRDIGSTLPAAVWAGARTLFDPAIPEIFFRTTTEGLRYLPTGYIPSDAVDTAWARMTVTADELCRLAASAPEALRSRLGGSTTTPVKLVTFEYSYLTVNRPWFTPQLFASTSWRFPAGVERLSDGGSPPTGRCTAYVTGLVLARNITVQQGPAPSGESAEEPEMGFLPSARWTRLLRADRPTLVSRIPIAAVTSLVNAEPAAPPADTAPVTTDARILERFPNARLTHVSRAQLEMSVPAMRPDTGMQRPEPQPVDPGITTTGTGPDELFIIAFQCRVVPKAPNPGGTPADTATPVAVVATPVPPAVTGCPPAGHDGAESSAEHTYVVRGGDTLSRIAKAQYGAADQWRKIYQANTAVIGPDPNRIQVGQVLVIP